MPENSGPQRETFDYQNDVSILHKDQLHALLTSVSTGEFKLHSEQEDHNLQKEKLESGMSGSKIVDSLLKDDVDQALQQDAIAESQANVIERGAHTLTNEKLEEEIQAGGRSQDTEKVLLALQQGNVSVDVCAEYLRKQSPEEVLSACENNLVRHDTKLGSGSELTASRELGDREELQKSEVITKWENKLKGSTSDKAETEEAEQEKNKQDEEEHPIQTQQAQPAMQQTNLVSAIGHAFGPILRSVFTGVGLAVGAGVKMLRNPKTESATQAETTPILQGRFEPATSLTSEWKENRFNAEFSRLKTDVSNHLKSINTEDFKAAPGSPSKELDSIKQRTARLTEIAKETHADPAPVEKVIHDWQNKLKSKLEELPEKESTNVFMEKINAILALFKNQDKKSSMTMR